MRIQIIKIIAFRIKGKRIIDSLFKVFSCLLSLCLLFYFSYDIYINGWNINLFDIKFILRLIVLITSLLIGVYLNKYILLNSVYKKIVIGVVNYIYKYILGWCILGIDIISLESLIEYIKEDINIILNMSNNNPSNISNNNIPEIIVEDIDKSDDNLDDNCNNDNKIRRTISSRSEIGSGYENISNSNSTNTSLGTSGIYSNSNSMNSMYDADISNSNTVNTNLGSWGTYSNSNSMNSDIESVSSNNGLLNVDGKDISRSSTNNSMKVEVGNLTRSSSMNSGISTETELSGREMDNKYFTSSTSAHSSDIEHEPQLPSVFSPNTSEFDSSDNEQPPQLPSVFSPNTSEFESDNQSENQSDNQVSDNTSNSNENNISTHNISPSNSHNSISSSLTRRTYSTNINVKDDNIIFNSIELTQSILLLRDILLDNSVSNIDSERYSTEEVDNIINDIINIIQIIHIVKDDYSKIYLSDIIKDIAKYFAKFGMDEKRIRDILNSNINNLDNKVSNINEIGSNEIDNFINQVNEIVSIKDVVLADKVINKLRRSLSMIENIKNNELSTEIDSIKIELISDLKSVLSKKTKEKGRNKRVKNMNASDYKGEFTSFIIDRCRDIKELLIKFIEKGSSESLHNLSKNINKINTILKDIYKENVKFLINSNTGILDYSKASMSHVLENTVRERNKLLNDFRIDRVNKLEDMVKIINTELDTSFEKRISKFSNDSSLTKMLMDILKQTDLSNYEMQLGIEKSLYNYDISWFTSEFNDSVDIRSTILHDIYRLTDNKINRIIQPYTINSFRKLNDLFKNIHIDKNKGEYLTIIMFIILGNSILINTCFRCILDLLSRNGNAVNRTEIAFSLASRIKKHTTFLINHKLNDLKDKNIERLLKNIDIVNVKEMIKNMNDMNDIELGDTILNIILNDTRIFNTELSSNRFNDRYISVSIRKDYLHKLAVSSTSITQLPMLIKPNIPDENGKYSPYILYESSHIYNSFDTVVKNKYNNKLNTENQDVLFQTINYLNGVKYKINKDILNYILNEWDNKDSKLFKGANILIDINESDKKSEKISKRAHNSIYWNYFNTISLACIYVNHEFYIPTFADFRGRIYTLSNYLSYQGNDLTRSLLLFADEKEKLNDNGLNYLLIYFANLYGHNKVSLEERIEWSKNNVLDIFNDYSEDIDNFNNKHLINIKEPLQFISIMFALVKAIECKTSNKSIVINNPILFDASCNGIQHLSAMTRDIDLAIKTNVVPNKSYPNLPEDFYTYACKLIQDELDIQSNKLNKIKLNRTLIKKSVMTIPYNISLTGVGHQLEEHFSKVFENNKYYIKIDAIYTKNHENIFLLPKEFGLLTKIVFITLTKKLPSLSALTKYLNSILKIIMILDKPIIWITPAGLKIQLSTIKYQSYKTKSKIIKDSNPITISLPTKDLDKMQIRRSFMPNLIHSLDASNIHLFINKLDKQAIYTVHDCFATSPNNMGLIEKYVKEAFIEIYFKDGNYLEKMHNNLIEQINSYKPIMTKDNISYITVNGTIYEIPQIPTSFTSNDLLSDFIKGITNSNFFIS